MRTETEMKKVYVINKNEKGQVIPMVILMFFVIIGMVALVIDGGALMSNRRTAQAAADAGALAGAQRACMGFNDAKAVAEYYAIVNNNATTALATVTGKQVTVNTTVEHPSFFARIFGDPTLDASAEAIAGCYGVKGKGVVPLAWRCHENDGVGPFNDEYGCEMQTLNWKTIGPLVDPSWDPASERVSSVSISDYDGNSTEYIKLGTNIVDAATNKIPPEQIYIVFDSDKLCIDPPNTGTGDIDCDLDNDGKNDLQLGGDRSWLYLTADTSSIGKWITDFGAHPSFTLDAHKWLTGKSGTETDIPIKMMDQGWPGQVVLIPVYNEICQTNPSITPACVANAHASPPWPAFSEEDDFSEIKNQDPYYHVIAFAPFYLSCVSKSGDCPGYIYADKVINSNNLKDNVPVIEGFFLSDVEVSPETTDFCSINLGNCTVSLSK